MKSNYHSILLGLLLLLILSCRGETKNKMDSHFQQTPGIITLSKQQFEANKMAFGRVREMTFPETIRVSGTIDVPPENRAIISAVFGGFVKKTSLLVGDQVRKGEVVAILENPDFLTLQQSYLEVTEQLPYLKAEFERQQTLFEEQISSEKLFLQAQSTYRSALARKSGLGKQLTLLGLQPDKITPADLRTDIRVTAPISGRVTQVNISTGSFVSRASEMLEIINPEHLHLELRVFEQDITKVEKGQSIRFRIPEVSNNEYEGEVYLVGSSIDKNRTVQVHGHLNSEGEEDLMVGMFVQADLLIESDKASEDGSATYLALPEEAIGSGATGPFVLILEEDTETDYRFRKVLVSTGPTSMGFTALTDPGTVKNTDEVLVKGVFLISDP